MLSITVIAIIVAGAVLITAAIRNVPIRFRKSKDDVTLEMGHQQRQR